MACVVLKFLPPSKLIVAQRFLRSCSILTTNPNTLTATVHDRMPSILRRDDYALWLDPGMTDADAISGLLKPYSGSMRVFPVSTGVNNTQNDDPECAKPVELETPPLAQLFES